ncbi:hypothetical protein [Mesorhizobium sp. M8A.F.Ca.ET.057.01.1.1]|uniref:hypothetical protein n=1 Tax=Mesorhizobium sp. M8A.F.Ca.ET.057.01.1.1 TaxID=2493679 RepID=UPI003A862FCA
MPAPKVQPTLAFVVERDFPGGAPGADRNQFVLGRRHAGGDVGQGPVESIAGPQPRRARPFEFALEQRVDATATGGDRRQSVYVAVGNVRLGADHELALHLVVGADMDAADRTVRIDGRVEVGGSAETTAGDEEIGFSGGVTDADACIEAGPVVAGRRGFTDIRRACHADRRENDGRSEKKSFHCVVCRPNCHSPPR